MRIKGVPDYAPNTAKSSYAIGNFQDKMYNCQDLLSEIEDMCFSVNNESPLEIMDEDELKYTVDRMFEAHNLLKMIKDNIKEMYRYIK